ncbi:MAG: Bug family tripartite tricarboxylate transporter substrate binding protein [Burkholderiales bacterium]
MKKPLRLNAKWMMATMAMAMASLSHAQSYPFKPVRLICSLAPGGASDVGLRILAQKLMENGWPQVLVENRTGGGGAVAAVAVKAAPPDGYTLFQGDIGALAMNPALQANLPYDSIKDFTPITNKFSFPSVLAVPANLPAKSVGELIGYLKQKGDAANYASQGIGSGGHLLGTMFVNAIGFPLTHVPYKGGGQAVPEVVAGRNDLIFSSYASVRSFVNGGQIRLLATTAKARMPELPNVATMTEAGHAAVFLDVWFGLLGPANMPAAITRTIHEQVSRALNAPDVVQKMAGLGLYVGTSKSPEEFGEMIRSEIQRVGVVVKQAGAVAN